MPLRVALATLGCKVNQYETVLMQEGLKEKGMKIVPFNQPADVYVINTCTVTHRSDYQSRQLIRRAKRTNNKAFIVVTGCYAQINPQAIQSIPGVNLILGNTHKDQLAEMLTHLDKTLATQIMVKPIPKSTPSVQISGFLDYTRAFVKIQDGCSAACSYCIVPRARGPSRSQPPQQVVQQIKKLVCAGYQEIVLTGIHIGVYGRDLVPETSLASLLRQIIQIEGLGRIRLSSIEPTEFSPALIEVLQSEKICPHLHIPLQSAHDQILEAMNRHYTGAQYQELVQHLTETIADLAIGADVMVGFPGETQQMFEHTYKFILDLPIAYLHVFRYSARPHTPAAHFESQVPEEVKRKRSRLLRLLSQQKSLQFRHRFLGRCLPSLILRQEGKQNGWLTALTHNYIKVLVPYHKQYINKLVSVRISHIEGSTTLGEVLRP